jgi:hypothetical protein
LATLSSPSFIILRIAFCGRVFVNESGVLK